MEYINEIDRLCEEVYSGIEEYAVSLEDLDGLVLVPISEMRELTLDAFSLPADIEQDVVLSYLDAAEAGAIQYAEKLYDTTSCTQPLDELLDYLGV